MTDHARNAGQPRHAQKITLIRPTSPDATGLAVEFTERAYIAALIRDPDGKKLIAEGVTVDHFTRPECREAFVAIGLLLADGIQPNAATIAALTDSATMIEVETSLKENVSAANRASYVTVLKDYKIKRQTVALNSQIAAAASAGQSPAELRALVEQIEALQRPDQPTTPSRFIRLSAMSDHPPAVDWLIEDYLERDTITQLFGDPGSGKSFIALDMALSIATGTAWRGHATQRSPVIYLAGEGLRGLQRRKEAWLRYNGIKDRSAPFWLSNSATALSNPGQLAALITDIDAALSDTDGPSLIIIDTVARNFGNGDENSTQDMGVFIAALDGLRERYRCCILLVHHSGHADKSRARGAIALPGSLDAEYRVEKIGDNTLTLTSTKQKDNDPPPDLAWTLERFDLPWADDRGQPLNSAVLVPHDSIPAAPVKEKLLTGIPRQALDALRELYQRQRETLVASEQDPNAAHVTISQWNDAMQSLSADKSYRSTVRRDLEKRGYVRFEAPYVHLNPDAIQEK